MGTRETFSRTFKCPKCGKTGEAVWEENSNPNHRQYAGSFDTTLERITPGFRSPASERVECKRCKVSAILN